MDEYDLERVVVIGPGTYDAGYFLPTLDPSKKESELGTEVKLNNYVTITSTLFYWKSSDFIVDWLLDNTNDFISSDPTYEISKSTLKALRDGMRSFVNHWKSLKTEDDIVDDESKWSWHIRNDDPETIEYFLSILDREIDEFNCPGDSYRLTAG
jgi:hypothetical protein